MIVLLALHAAIGVLILSMSARLQRLAWAVGAIPMVATLAYVAARGARVVDGRPVTEHYAWVPDLDLAIDLRLDGFGLLMTLIVSGIGVVIMAYASQYFPTSQAATRTAGLLVLFSGSMLGLVTADHLLFLYICWELTSITSWQLIGSKNTDPAARSGALHALLVTSIGGLALLAGLVVIGQAAGTYRLSEILANPPSGGSVGIGLGLALVGVMTKSAQFPTHAWLPGAMVAPTPVSAYLHSATMVKAGVYLAARLAPAFAATGAWRSAITVVGIVTMLLGGLRALRQQDLKLLLAMGTISQLGFMLVLFGVGHPEATTAGVTLILAHALFKAALFLVVGIVDHQAGTRAIGELAGFGTGWRTVKVVTVVSAASMAGLPPLVGFIAKEGAFEAFGHGSVWDAATLAGLVVGSVLTVAYSYRFAAAVLAPPPEEASAPPPPSPVFTAPALLLTGLTVLGGVVAGVLDPLVEAAANTLDPGIGHVHLALWHGFGLPLYLSAAVVVLGATLAAAARPVARLQRALAPQFGGEQAFAQSVHGLYALSRRVTSVVQNGSLPVYCAVILLTALILPGAIYAADRTWPGWPDLADSPLQAALAAVLIGAALAAATVNRRFTAVLLLGGVGYGMGLLFVLQGAPDLALTQFSIETLSIVVFTLVLRRLPYGFRPQFGRRVWALRVLVSCLVGLGVFGFALVNSTPGPPERSGDAQAAGSETSSGDEADVPVRSAAEEAIQRSEPQGDGQNVVNVVLVDFRGLDTLGEISVLATAALGIVGLARVRSKPPSDTARRTVARGSEA